MTRVRRSPAGGPSLRLGFVTPEFVTEANFNGGLANYLYRLSLALRELGHRPVVVVASDRDEALEQDGIEVHRVRIATPRWMRAFGRLARRRADLSLHTLRQAWLLRERLRLLHAREPFALIQYPNYTAPGVLRLSGVPAVLRLSSYMPLWQANGTPASRQEVLWERLAIKRADALFGPSHVVADAVQARFKRRVEVIETPFVLEPLELDESVYRERLAGLDYLLFVGSLNVLKGVANIAAAIPEVLGRHLQLRFVLVGEQNAVHLGRPLLEHVRQRAGAAADRVIHIDRLRHAQLYPIVAHATAVVLPSRIDNLPNTCLEAMAHRRVVVGTRGASFEQLLRDGESGFLCERDDPDSLAAAIERALRLTADERTDMGERAWRRIQELRPQRTVRALLAFYERVLAARARKTGGAHAFAPAAPLSGVVDL